MSANQRRSGFRLPWLSETEESGEAEASAHAAPVTPPPAEPAGERPTATPDTNGRSPESGGAAADPASDTADPAGASAAKSAASDESATAAAGPTEPAVAPPTGAQHQPTGSEEPPNEFLRDLIGAMRTVADEARQHGVEKLKTDADEAVRALEAEAEKRRLGLRERAETDINEVGEWARAEAERIKTEAEQRVAARRAQLEQQLSAESTRTEAEAKALRARVDEYERELEAYHAQLAEINDPAAFAAAAKRMPPPPDLRPRGAEPPAAEEPTMADLGAAGAGTEVREPATAAGTAPEVHPAEEEVLAARLAQLDEKLGATEGTPAGTDPGPESVPATTDIVVKGLGSFGAITGFRQSLSGQPGISAVALSLGQNGEFVFRATHAPGFDVAATITSMEGDNATVESRPEGGLHVTLERSR